LRLHLGPVCVLGCRKPMAEPDAVV
jgi:hypothetical protein